MFLFSSTTNSSDFISFLSLPKRLSLLPLSLSPKSGSVLLCSQEFQGSLLGFRLLIVTAFLNFELNCKLCVRLNCCSVVRNYCVLWNFLEFGSGNFEFWSEFWGVWVRFLCFCCCRVVFWKQIVANWDLELEVLPPFKLGFFTFLRRVPRFQWTCASCSLFVELSLFL